MMSPTPKKKSSRRAVAAPATVAPIASGPRTSYGRQRRRIVKTALGAVIGGAVAGPLGAAAGAVITALNARKSARLKLKGPIPVKELSPAPKPAKATAHRQPQAARPRRRSAVDIYPPIP